MDALVLVYSLPTSKKEQEMDFHGMVVEPEALAKAMVIAWYGSWNLLCNQGCMQNRHYIGPPVLSFRSNEKVGS